MAWSLLAHSVKLILQKLLTSPKRVRPQMTTDPSSRMAAKAVLRGLDLLHILQLILHSTAVPTMGRTYGPRSPQMNLLEWQQKQQQRLGFAAHSSAAPARHYCHRHGQHYPTLRRIHRREWQQKRHRWIEFEVFLYARLSESPF